MSRDITKPKKWVCAQRRLRSTWASAQLRTQAFFMRTAKTLIRLGECPGWSESSLGAHSFCWFCHVSAQIFWSIFFCFVFSCLCHLFRVAPVKRKRTASRHKVTIVAARIQTHSLYTFCLRIVTLCLEAVRFALPTRLVILEISEKVKTDGHSAS